MSTHAEAIEEFQCFGSTCAALVIGSAENGSAHEAAALARRTLLCWHERFSRFLPESELSQLNRDPRHELTVRPLMARLAHAVHTAGSLTGGLVDATLLGEIEQLGYTHDLGVPIPLATALPLAPARAPGGSSRKAGWRQIEVDLAAGVIRRPPGVMLDSGGLAKGLFADVLGQMLRSHHSFAINCAGDLLIGGTSETTRAINVESPFDGRILHTFESSQAGVATSGIGRRSWLQRNGEPAHHLLDPATGRPVFTGIVQVTALAPSALLAEIHAKAALLSGPHAAASWLTHGGVIVFDDGSHQVVPPPPVVTLSQLSGFVNRPVNLTLQDA
jgi:thiamine biosynthesis lipoprotein